MPLGISWLTIRSVTWRQCINHFGVQGGPYIIHPHLLSLLKADSGHCETFCRVVQEATGNCDKARNSNPDSFGKDTASVKKCLFLRVSKSC